MGDGRAGCPGPSPQAEPAAVRRALGWRGAPASAAASLAQHQTWFTPDVITVAFLHTADIHVATFRELLSEVAPGAMDVHLVDTELLSDARRHGVDAGIEARVLARLRELAVREPGAIVCTCSTLSGSAERLAQEIETPWFALTDRWPSAPSLTAAAWRLWSLLTRRLRLLGSCSRSAPQTLAATQFSSMRRAWTHGNYSMPATTPATLSASPCTSVASPTTSTSSCLRRQAWPPPPTCSGISRSLS